MSKKSLVDSIEIKSPCSESWDAMTGNEKVRFCSHCSKNVNNISQLTRKQAMRLVRDAGGNLCVRYVKNPVNNQPVFADKFYQITRRAGLAAGVLGASLTFSTLAYAQGAPRLIKNEDVVQSEILSEKNKTVSTKGRIQGTITDVNGVVIPKVKVQITNETTEKLLVAVADENGFYEFKEVEAGTYSLIFYGIDSFEKKEIRQITIAEAENRTQDVLLEFNREIENLPINGRIMVMGDIAFVEYRSPLHQAVANEDFETAQNLIANGGNVNQKDENYNNITPLFLAVENGNVEMAELLLRFGAKVNVRDDNKQMPLMRLDSDASVELVRLLLRYGTKINMVDAEGNTPLILAAENSAGAEVLQILLNEGANPNAQNKKGHTALMNAAENDNLEIVRALLVAGANVNLKNKEGETAWDLTSNDEIEKLLESYGAETGER